MSFNPLLSIMRMAVIGTAILLLMPFQAAVLALIPKHYGFIPYYFHRLVCFLAGIEVQIKGQIPSGGPNLLICNHSSYMDIVILSSLLPTSFVAKAEIAGWPLFGWLGKLQRTVFIRRVRSEAKTHVDQVTTALQSGRNLVLFPEGTSSDHNRVLPFKPTLLRAADTKIDGEYVNVQPVCLSFVGINSLPVGRLERPYFAWYGDMDLIPHLFRLLGFGRTQFVVEFFPIVRRDQFADHKAMAQYCQTQIAAAHNAARAQRATPVLPAPAAILPAPQVA